MKIVSVTRDTVLLKKMNSKEAYLGKTTLVPESTTGGHRILTLLYCPQKAIVM